MLKKIMVISLTVLSISGCVDMEEVKAKNKKDNLWFDELQLYHSKPLSSITCETVDHQYERCSEYDAYNRIEYCQNKYTPVLMRCYGIKQANN